jgi:hypothetical protein
MLNATTYRTLSATTTGLNLGTRTLAAKAGAVNVAITLRTALDQSHQRMRSQRFGMRDHGIPFITDCLAIIPSSPRWPASSQAAPGVEVLADLPPEVQDVVVVDGLVVPVGRPGVVVVKRRYPAAKTAKAAAVAAARPSTCPAARFVAGG